MQATLNHLTQDGHADIGFLTQQEYDRFVWAWDNAPRIASWLYSPDCIATAEDNIRVSGTPTPSTPLTPAYLAADEITSHLHAINRFTTPEEVANHHQGSTHARELGKLVSAADRAWPQVERPHFIKYMSCGGCEQLTLRFKPPRFPGDKIMIDCWCGYTLTEAEFALAAHILELDAKEAA